MMINIMKDIELLLKKILGNKNYQFIRKIFLFIYVKTIKNIPKELEGNFILKNDKYSIRMLKDNKFSSIKKLYSNELMKRDKLYILPLSKNRFLESTNFYFGIFKDQRMIAYFTLNVRGYRNFEYGISVSKHYRRIGIAKTVVSLVETFLNKHNYDFYVPIHLKKKKSSFFFKKRGFSLIKKI